MAFEFTPKTDKMKPGLAIGTVLGKKPVKGEVGIEIEVEGKNLLYHEKVPPPWIPHEDHSLRGEENAEYVLQGALPFSEVPKALDVLYKALKKNKAKLDDSNRTSVHVHLNCQEFHLNRLTSFLGIYFTLEEILTEWCGEERVGNLFCLRAKDAEAIIAWLKRFIRQDCQSNIPEILRYGNLNANSLFKFGSLEIRSLRGTDDPKVIEQWISILERLYTISADFPDPREVCTMVSGTGAMNFFETMLGDKATLVRQGISFTDNDIVESIYAGVRLAQDLCYCREWELYKPMPLKPDPFSRNMKKVAQKLMHQEFGDVSASGPSMTPPISGYGMWLSNAEAEVADDQEFYDPEPEYDDNEGPSTDVPY